MRLTRTRVALGIPLTLATSLALAAGASCGSRTGLLEETQAGDAGTDGDVLPDVLEEPGIDALQPDVPFINSCPDAASTLIYVFGYSNKLYSFDPSAGTFSAPIGTLSCPGAGLSTPFSMAVDRAGVAYVVYQEMNNNFASALYLVSMKTAECWKTKYDPASNMNATFGMGFVANVGDAGDAGKTGDQLFISLDVNGITSNGELATLDTRTFKATQIGLFSPPVFGAELTGTGDGRLFAFSPSMRPGRSYIRQIDPTTAKVLATYPLAGIRQGQGWAFGFWGGAFYLFTGTGPQDSMGTPSTEVHKYDPVSMSLTLVGSLGDLVVGAGVSTCAPQEPDR